MRALDGGRGIVFAFSVFVLFVGLIATELPKVAAAAQPDPAAAPLVELEGELEILHQDFKQSGRYLYFLKTPDGARIPLHFAQHPPTNLLTGAYVRVRGSQSDGTLMLASGGSASITTLSATTSSTAPLPNTFGAQNTAVILVNFQDNPTNQPWTLAQVQSAVFGSAGANGFFLENSYGQSWLTGGVFGWFTIPLSSTSCDITIILSYAQSAASAAGVNLSAYTHFVYAFPQDNACGWAGSSYIGGIPSQS